MKFTLRSSFARYVVTLFVSVIALTVAGRIVTLSDAAQFCAGWPLCIPSAPVGWLKLAHLSLVGIASILMALVFRKAWQEQRSHRLILPLTTILGVMFFGQALVGAALISQSEARHLFVLHTLTTVALWISLVLLVYASGINHEAESVPPLAGKLQRVKDLFALTKPLIVGLLLITTYGGLVIGMKAIPSFSLTFWTLLGGALAAGGSGALNQYIDRELDRRMQRTAKRPMADGRLTDAEGLAFGLGMSLISYYLLACFVNDLAALLSLAGIAYYVILYSMWLKKATVQNIVIGGGAGAIPPMVGYAAATGHLDWTAWILFAIIFMWTPPHFWALAIVRMKDYEHAGVPMMPVVRGEMETRRQIFVYTIELVIVTLLLPILNLAGTFYLVSSLVLGGALLYAAWAVWRSGGNKLAWRMYKWSSSYLVFIFLAIMIDAVL
ncbi:MAG TPA: heme o synthase [Anaerolineales bacterium]|nr:protoheme IX farnesyltransferase [Anaerolineales bacterium]HNQ94039.1 heme o synthase [Anaerolineales bacterium]HNS60581.1 heme o synthase [Anaerolineales bacterium]